MRAETKLYLMILVVILLVIVFLTVVARCQPTIPTMTHNKMDGKQGGTTDEYYHLEYDDYNGLTNLTEGRITFVQSNGSLIDDANLYWDDVNAFLGVQDSTPNYPIDVSGNIRARGTLRVDEKAPDEAAYVIIDASDECRIDMQRSNSRIWRLGTPSLETGRNTDFDFFNASLDTVFTIDQTGNVYAANDVNVNNYLRVGTSSSARTYTVGSRNNIFMFKSSSGSDYSSGFEHIVSDGGGVTQTFHKSRGSNIVQDDDNIADIAFVGWDGDEYVKAAQIRVSVDDTPGDEDMPGRIIFYTTPDDSKTLTERIRIDNQGIVTIQDRVDANDVNAVSYTDGTASLTGGSLTSVKLGTLTNNGFVTTSGGDGTLSVDTGSYYDVNDDIECNSLTVNSTSQFNDDANFASGKNITLLSQIFFENPGGFKSDANNNCYFTMSDNDMYFVVNSWQYIKLIGYTDENFPFPAVPGTSQFNISNKDIDFRVDGDNNDNIFFVDASTDRVGINDNTPDANLDVAGDAYFGDGDGGDSVYIDSNGVITLAGAARKIVHDSWISASGMSNITVGATLGVNGNGFQVYSFADNTEKYVEFNLRIPNEMDYSADSYICIYWSTPADTKICEWDVVYNICGEGDTTDQAGTSDLNNQVNSGDPDAMNMEYIVTISGGTISGDDYTIQIILKRDGNEAGDTLSAVAELHGADFAYYKSTMGGNK